LRLDQISDLDVRMLPTTADLKSRLKQGTVELEELLDAGLQTRWYAWGSDGTTGAFAVCQSDRIRSRDRIEITQ
jgi:hypothetical protein